MRNENICEGNVLTFKPRHYYTINRRSYEVELNSDRKLVETAKYLASLTIPCSSNWEPSHPESALIKALVLCGYMDFNSSGETVSGTDLVMPKDDNSLVEEIFASVSNHFAPPDIMADLVICLGYDLRTGLQAIQFRRNRHKLPVDHLEVLAPVIDTLEGIANELSLVIRSATLFANETNPSGDGAEAFAKTVASALADSYYLPHSEETLFEILRVNVFPRLHKFFKQAIVGPNI